MDRTETDETRVATRGIEPDGRMPPREPPPDAAAAAPRLPIVRGFGAP